MKSRSRTKVLGAFRQLLDTIARIFFRIGMGYSEFDAIARRAFVEVATNEYGVRGRPTNVARVSAMTGISRGTVRKIQADLLADGDSSADTLIPPARVINAWFTQGPYCDTAGHPISLPYDGEQISFVNLVSSVETRSTPGAIRAELIRVGCLVEASDGRLHLVSRHYIRSDLIDRLVFAVSFSLQNHLETIRRNTDPDYQHELKFERVAYSLRLTGKPAEIYTKLASAKLNACLEELMELADVMESESNEGALANDSSKASAGGEPDQRLEGAVGVGMYLFDGR
ncbi:MAG: DUF6502 family protein [Pseudomonadota bacterium]